MPVGAEHPRKAGAGLIDAQSVGAVFHSEGSDLEHDGFLSFKEQQQAAAICCLSDDDADAVEVGDLGVDVLRALPLQPDAADRKIGAGGGEGVLCCCLGVLPF